MLRDAVETQLGRGRTPHRWEHEVCCARFSSQRIKVECSRDERFVKARRVNAKNFFAELKRPQTIGAPWRRVQSL